LPIARFLLDASSKCNSTLARHARRLAGIWRRERRL
jgi:hypothetical protein